MQPSHEWVLLEAPLMASAHLCGGPALLPAKAPEGLTGKAFSDTFHLPGATASPTFPDYLRKPAYLEEYEDEKQLVDHTDAEPEPPVSYKDREHTSQGCQPGSTPLEASLRSECRLSPMPPASARSFPRSPQHRKPVIVRQKPWRPALSPVWTGEASDLYR